MKPVEIFKLIVRAFGVYLLYQGTSVIPDVLIAMSDSDRYSGQAFLRLVGLFGAAMWFLFGAPPIQQFAYPESPSNSPTKSEDVETPNVGPPCVACGKPTPDGSTICPACGWTQPR
jgi:hypothetical protein